MEAGIPSTLEWTITPTRRGANVPSLTQVPRFDQIAVQSIEK